MQEAPLITRKRIGTLSCDSGSLVISRNWSALRQQMAATSDLVEGPSDALVTIDQLCADSTCDGACMQQSVPLLELSHNGVVVGFEMVFATPEFEEPARLALTAANVDTDHPHFEETLQAIRETMHAHLAEWDPEGSCTYACLLDSDRVAIGDPYFDNPAFAAPLSGELVLEYRWDATGELTRLAVLRKQL